MKTRIPTRRGFSLIEIVVALAVISFSMVAIVGIVSMGVNSNKTSLDNSLVGAMSRQVVAGLRQQTFANIPLIETVTGAGATIQTTYFDANGIPSSKQNAVYQCVVTARSVAKSTTDPVGLGPQPPVSATIPNMMDINLQFTWPVTSATSNSYTIKATIARYQ